MGDVGLTERDWVEIYYALDSKKTRIESGDYGPSDPDVSVEEWAAHLGEILEKIGPDGENMYE